MLKIVVMGTGYVGLVSGTCFAELGHDVVCVDKDKAKIDGLKLGTKVPIFEKGLEDLIKNNQARGRLDFALDISGVINESDIVIVAVGTPLDAKGRTNFDYINQCVSEIVVHAKRDLHVIIKSTVPVGTCDSIQKRFDQESSCAINVVSNPEFLREGEAVQDFLLPDRVVIGSELENRGVIDELYRELSNRGVEILYTNRVTAELIKYASNSFLAAKVAFINEIADLSESLGGDIGDISRGMGLDKRIGHKFLNAGPGFGGSCFPKDTKALINTGNDHGVELPLVGAISLSNEMRHKQIVKRIKKMVRVSEEISVLGLTYKAGTDDIRCSPAINIARELSAQGFKLRVHDPKGIAKAKKELRNMVSYYDNLYDAAKGTSLCVVATEWDDYKNLDSEKLANYMKKRHIYDLRKVINNESFVKSGFKVMVVGYRSE